MWKVKLSTVQGRMRAGICTTSGSSHEKMPLKQHKLTSYIPPKQTNKNNRCKHEKVSSKIIVKNFDFTADLLSLLLHY